MEKIKSIAILIALVVISGLVLVGCKKKEESLKFNHRLHVQEVGMRCSDCHFPGKDGKMGNPGMDKCNECHEIDVKHPSKACLMCHSKSSLNGHKKAKEVMPEKPKSYADLIFTHEAHEGVAKCTDCHKGIDKVKGLRDIKWPDMLTCEKCHNGKKAPMDCDVCHTKIRKDVAPASHHGDWTMQHGPASRFDKSCQYCHGGQSQFCQDCHQTHKPKDHIFNWKTTQHGEEATHDRRSCAVCHTASYCSDCHRREKPISHARADWMAYTRDNGHAEAARHNFRSCNVCHTTSECNECHQKVILRYRK